jgi:hypothetical protein
MPQRDYTLLLRATADTAPVQQQIDALIQRYRTQGLNLTVNINTTQLTNLQNILAQINTTMNNLGNGGGGGNAGGMGGGGGGGVTRGIFDPQAVNLINDRMEQIRSLNGVISKYNINTNETGEATSATVTYTNALNQSISERYALGRLQEGGDLQLLRVGEKLNDNILARTKAMDSNVQAAREFLSASENKNKSNPSVSQGRNLANQIIGVGNTDFNKSQELTNQLNQVKQGAMGASTGMRAFGTELASSMRRVVEYSLSLGLIYGALNQLKQGIQYIKDLNKEMTNIQVLGVQGATTNEEITKLSGSFNDLAKSMGATTIEVARGSTEWLRQGKTVAETEELLKSTLMLAKLGALDTAEATDYLTSTLNSYKLSAKDAESVVDKLIAVDNKAATSAGELATALKFSSSSAQQAGVSLEQLISYIGTVSSVTRASSETIGQSFPQLGRGIGV